jgi:hypothetical protein
MIYSIEISIPELETPEDFQKQIKINLQYFEELENQILQFEVTHNQNCWSI